MLKLCTTAIVDAADRVYTNCIASGERSTERSTEMVVTMLEVSSATRFINASMQILEVMQDATNNNMRGATCLQHKQKYQR